MDEAVDRAIAALAARQHGYVTRPQLLELGLGREAVVYRVRIGRLISVYAGVYAAGRVPKSPVDKAAAAVLACGRGAVLSHGSAATLWGLRKQWSGTFEVTTRSAHRRRGIRVHRSVALTRRDIRHHLGIHVTSPARTVLDVAPALDDAALTRTVNDARLSLYLRLSDLAELIDRCPRHPGANRLGPFVRAPNGPTRSQLEDEFLAFTQRFELPRPKLNASVAGHRSTLCSKPKRSSSSSTASRTTPAGPRSRTIATATPTTSLRASRPFA